MPSANSQKQPSIGLPHLDGGITTQHIIYRLADSIPSRRIALLQDEMKDLQSSVDQSNLYSERMEEILDQGLGSCILGEPEIAKVIVDTWKHFEAERYDLRAYVVMPNHCHVLIQTNGTCALGQIVLSWKSFTARRINEWKLRHNRRDLIATGRRVWYPDYWDRYVRSLEHFEKVVWYIENNPVKAGLVDAPGAWRWSSASSL